jgi:hypothetical protein
VRAFGEERDDRVTLRQVALAGHFQQRNAAVGIFREKGGSARGAGADVELDQLVRQRELLEHEANFVAVSGGQVIV